MARVEPVAEHVGSQERPPVRAPWRPPVRAPWRPPVRAPRAVRIGCSIALGLLCLWLFVRGASKVVLGYPDFEYFYKAGQSVLLHGSLDGGYDVLPDGSTDRRGTIDWYLPFMARVMSPIALLPQSKVGLAWVAFNVLVMLATLRLIGRELMGLPKGDWPVTVLLPFIFLAAYWEMEFRLNQVNNLTMLLLVGSFVLWQRGRAGLSGFWLGLAVLIKLTPGLVVLWFALKRQYRTVAAAGLTILLAGPASDAVVFGPRGAADHYAGWFQRAVASGSHRGLILEQREMDWRNQGLGAVLSRWLHPTNWATHFDNEPRAAHRTAARAYFNVASLSRGGVALLANLIALGSVAGLVLLARRPARELTSWQLRFEWSLFVLAMLWLMPVMRQYHVVWATPAMCMLAAGIHHMGHRSGWAKLALASIGLVIVLQAALASDLLKAMGVTLVSIPVLALPVVVLLARLQRNPGLVPEAAAEETVREPRVVRDKAAAEPGPDALPAHA